MDIHGENPFKSKSYSSAAFAIEKMPQPLTEIPSEKISTLKGIGTSSAQKIIELLQTGKIKVLEEILSNTPSGIIEMLQIKGIGPKKIHTIWKEMEIESVGELLYACKENRLKLYKGFGEKTQQNVMDSIAFYLQNKGSYLFANLEPIAVELELMIKNIFPQNKVELTGAFKRQLEIIEQLDFLIDASINEVLNNLNEKNGFHNTAITEDYIHYRLDNGLNTMIHVTTQKKFIEKSIQLSSSPDFWSVIESKKADHNVEVLNEDDFFTAIGLQPIPHYYRENPVSADNNLQNNIRKALDVEDIKGIIHCHSNWSDGNNSIEEMAIAALAIGMEYLVITDHSKSAFYAQGLSEEKILEQHHYINELNAKLSPFTIFKGIESDILFDGSLDYSDEILKQFDVVIASIHSNLKMTEEKAMQRLIKAIENPYTTLLGHMTGRLLLSRPGYPVDHYKIIDACAANHVAIELNAHPSRLDIDWRYIEYAIQKNVMISINPDAHQIEGLSDIKYGVYSAQKALLNKENNLSSMGKIEFEQYINNMKTKKATN